MPILKRTCACAGSSRSARPTSVTPTMRRSCAKAKEETSRQTTVDAAIRSVILTTSRGFSGHATGNRCAANHPCKKSVKRGKRREARRADDELARRLTIMALPVSDLDDVHQLLDAARGLVEGRLFFRGELDLNDLLHAPGAQFRGHADEQVVDAVLAL